MTDIIMYYELPERSMDSYLLIQAEMKKRGYSVRFSNNFWTGLWKNLFRIPRIVLTSGCRNLEDISFQDGYLLKKDVVWVNLQEEQIAYSGDGFLDSFKPQGRAKEAYHFCWGQFAKDYMEEAGVAKNHVIEMPPLQFDLSKPKFSRLYKTREEIAEEYGIDPQKKWILFASDFFEYATYYTEELLQQRVNEAGELRRIIYKQEEINCSILSKWWDRLLSESDDYVMIYRPHPSEYNRISQIGILEEKYESFKIIKDYSIKQWNHVIDIFTTWTSTSVMEAYYSGIPYFALSAPESLSNGSYISIFDEKQYITEYEDYRIAMEDPEKYRNEWNPLNRVEVERYYGNLNDEYAYKKICDYLERILKDGKVYRNMKLHLSFREKNASVLRGHYMKVTFRNDLIFFLSPLLFKIFPGKRKTIQNVVDTIERFNKEIYKEHKATIEEIINEE